MKLTNKPKGSEEVNKTSSEHIELLQTIKTRKRPGFIAGRLPILKTVIQQQSPRVEVENKNELNLKKVEMKKSFISVGLKSNAKVLAIITKDTTDKEFDEIAKKLTAV